MQTNTSHSRTAGFRDHFDGLSPSQTVGPFFHGSLQERSVVAGPGCLGEPILLVVRLRDGEDAPVADGMVEVWQADAAGRYPHPADPRHAEADPAFLGHGRLAADADGACIFATAMPGAVRAPVTVQQSESGLTAERRHGGQDDDGNGEARYQAPHINLQIMARGLLKPLVTRVYFDGNPANAVDPVLSLVPKDRRNTLMAKPVMGNRIGAAATTEPVRWELTIRLAGPGETVFFDV